MRACPQCAGGLTRTKTEQLRVVAGATFQVRSPAHACKSCRAVFMSGEVLERVDLEVATVLALKGPRGGETLRFMRKALGLRGLELAALLDVTGETVSRWEHDQRAVDPMAWILVGSLVLEQVGHEPATLRRLLAIRQKTPKLPKTLRIEVAERPVAGVRPAKTKSARVA